MIRPLNPSRIRWRQREKTNGEEGPEGRWTGGLGRLSTDVAGLGHRGRLDRGLHLGLRVRGRRAWNVSRVQGARLRVGC